MFIDKKIIKNCVVCFSIRGIGLLISEISRFNNTLNIYGEQLSRPNINIYLSGSLITSLSKQFQTFSSICSRLNDYYFRISLLVHLTHTKNLPKTIKVDSVIFEETIVGNRCILLGISPFHENS